MKRKENDLAVMLETLGALYTKGYAIGWQTLYPGEHTLMRIPTFPWQRERYWSEADAAMRERLGLLEHPLLGHRVKAPQPLWKLNLNRQLAPYLSDHQIMGATVLPGAAYVEMALAAATLIFGKGAYQVEDITFHKALFLSDEHDASLYMMLDTRQGFFTVHSEKKEVEQEWTLHATLKINQG